jgi:MFS family permease
LLVVYCAAAVQTAGLQAITPALPAMEKALHLSDPQIALVTTAYLLPSFALAMPLGAAADRLGRRLVFSSALLVFGLSGLATVLVRESFMLILACRVVQGAAVAAILPITITIIGDSLAGRAQLRAQAWRNISLNIGGAALPAIGGLLVAVAWYVPFLLPVIAIPLGIAALVTVPSHLGRSSARGGQLRSATRWWHNGQFRSLASANFLRLFLTFSLVTYLPVLAVRNGVSTVEAGLALSLAAALGAGTALTTAWITARVTATLVVVICQSIFVLALVMIAAVPGLMSTFVAAALFGSADGVLSVLLNTLTSSAAPTGVRATFVSTFGMVKNLGKFCGPAFIGAAAVFLPLSTACLIVAAIGLVGLLTLKPLTRLEALLRTHEQQTIGRGTDALSQAS